ncbi:unnamed protein product [Closterium sp. NIES-65]|nr:unnamed protein product [Closterium sp. NIES-65]
MLVVGFSSRCLLPRSSLPLPFPLPPSPPRLAPFLLPSPPLRAPCLAISPLPFSSLALAYPLVSPTLSAPPPSPLPCTLLPLTTPFHPSLCPPSHSPLTPPSPLPSLPPFSPLPPLNSHSPLPSLNPPSPLPPSLTYHNTPLPASHAPTSASSTPPSTPMHHTPFFLSIPLLRIPLLTHPSPLRAFPQHSASAPPSAWLALPHTNCTKTFSAAAVSLPLPALATAAMGHERQHPTSASMHRTLQPAASCTHLGQASPGEREL